MRHWEKLQLLNLTLACSNSTVCFPVLVFLFQAQRLGPILLDIGDGGTWETTRKPWGESSYPRWVWESCISDALALCSILPLCGKILLYTIEFNCSEKLWIWVCRTVSWNLKQNIMKGLLIWSFISCGNTSVEEEAGEYIRTSCEFQWYK